MFKIIHGAFKNLPDVNNFIEMVIKLDQHKIREARSLFDNKNEILVTRAPGRLDVMGGIGDYSGSFVLQKTIKEATFAAFNIKIEPKEIALLCQKVENLIAGAPCGIMDQMTSVFGTQNELMALLCQPAELNEPVKIPEDLFFWGMDSGVHHSVGGTAYGSVRVGAFMGYRILAEIAKYRVINNE